MKKFLVIAALLIAAIGADVQAKPKGTLQGVVNVNEATVAQLTMLPGVGPKKAADIVKLAKTSPFKRIEDLAKVKGIGKKAVEKLRAFVTVNGPTTAKFIKSSPPKSASR